MKKTSKTTTTSGVKRGTATKSEPVVFFGTGPVAAAALERLARHFPIEAIITKPKPEHHRGNFPVLEVAERLGLKIMTVTDRQSLSGLFETGSQKPFNSHVGVVIDFGIIINQGVIDYFPLGLVNSHFSLLPRWRGADPITFAVLSGDPKTGVSLMLIDAGLDTGKLIAQKSLPLSTDETTPSLTQKLIELSDKLLVEYLPKYLVGEIKPRVQPHPDRVTHSRKLTKDDGQIDWSKPAEQIEREIRAFIEWPKSHAIVADKEVIITKAHAVPSTHPENQPGDIDTVKEAGVIMVECGQGSLCIERLKPAGKAEMSAAEFIRGYLKS